MNLLDAITADKGFIMVNRDAAVAIGLNESIVLKQLHSLTHNTETAKMRDGQWCVRNTWASWRKYIFPFWSVATIRRAFRNLEKMGLVHISIEHHDNSNAVKTQWFSLNENAVIEFDCSASTSLQSDTTPLSNCNDPGINLEPPSYQSATTQEIKREEKRNDDDKGENRSSIIDLPLPDEKAPESPDPLVGIFQEGTGLQFLTLMITEELASIGTAFDDEAAKLIVQTTTAVGGNNERDLKAIADAYRAHPNAADFKMALEKTKRKDSTSKLVKYFVSVHHSMAKPKSVRPVNHRQPAPQLTELSMLQRDLQDIKRKMAMPNAAMFAAIFEPEKRAIEARLLELEGKSA